MHDPNNPSTTDNSFPTLGWPEEEKVVRPVTQALHEGTLEQQVEGHIALIGQHYQRVAGGIKNFWGHRDCVEYIQGLVFNGYKEGEKRQGFKPEVIESLLTLVELHQRQFGK